MIDFEIIGYKIILHWMMIPLWLLFLICLITGVAPDKSNLIIKRKEEPFGYWIEMGIIFIIAQLPVLFFNMHLWAKHVL